MALSKEDSTKIVSQLQHAHRIAAAFYKRILPTFDGIATNLNCDFWHWEPAHTSMPSKRGSTPPSRSWTWDYLPLFASNHHYWRKTDVTAQPEDICITFALYIDDNIIPENRKKLGYPGQPDPLIMDIGKAVLKVYILRPASTSTKPLELLWDETEYPTNSIYQLLPSGYMNGVALEYPLDELMLDTSVILKDIAEITK